jgi:predicted kinase
MRSPRLEPWGACHQTHFAATHAHVSKDVLRNNKRPTWRQAQLIEEALAAGRSVVVDNTNATIAERAVLIAQGRRYGAEIVGYFFESRVGASLERNRRRAGRARVPDIAIYVTIKRPVPPSYAEGFDRLHSVRIVEDGTFAVGAWGEDGATPGTERPHV